ncbi:MAG TPA: hypothetical protein V6D10_07400 [Trichocoleus sp.]|jgi:DNA-binding IclR family transcriptional regulator
MKPPKHPKDTITGAAILTHLRSTGQKEKALAIAAATGCNPSLVRRYLMRLRSARLVNCEGTDPVHWFAVEEEVDR